MEDKQEYNYFFAEAKFLLKDDVVYKSCPNCSKREGKYIFYPCPELFGVTEKRVTKTNPLGLQSYCVPCRGNKVDSFQDALYIDEQNEKNMHMIKEIRFLPMSTDIFSTIEQVSDFILNVLPNRGGKYYFIESKMNCSKGDFILFQYRGQLVAYAIYNDLQNLSTPITVNGVEYKGYYEFLPETIRLLNAPITAEQFKTIDSQFKNFNQSHQKKCVGLLPAIMMLINGNIKKSMQHKNNVLLPEEVEEEIAVGLKEGAKKQIVVNAYERNPNARKRCIEYYKNLNNGKVKCEICGFEFGKFYGMEFEGQIHVHHIVEISMIGEEYEIVAEKDLIPICPNCHLAIHSRKPAYLPDEIRNMIKE